MLTRDEWMASQEASRPTARSRRSAARARSASTPPRAPPVAGRCARSTRARTGPGSPRCGAYGIWGCGVRPADTAYIAFGYGSFIGFWGLHYAMEKVGVLNVPGGAQTTETRVLQIIDFGATVVAATPTYAMRLAQEAAVTGGRSARVRGLAADPVGRAGGVDPADQGADRGAVGRQGVRHRGDDRDRHDHGVRVLAPAGGTHIIEDHVIEEVLDPDSLEPVPYGERRGAGGDLVRAGRIPLLRYRTRRPRCAGCRRPRARAAAGFDIYEGGILGRVDDMKMSAGPTCTRGRSRRSCASSPRSTSSRR